MSNEWNNLSESYGNRQKHIASIKLKKKIPIYKHVVLRKFQIPQEESDISKYEEPIDLPQPSETKNDIRSHSLCSCNIMDKSGIHYSMQNFVEKISLPRINIREGSLNVNFLRGKQDLYTYLRNSRINLGKKFSNPQKKQILTEISSSILNIGDREVNFYCFYNEIEKNFNVVCFGDTAPLSDCCKLHLIVQLSHDFGGKIICPRLNCILQCLGNFIIAKEFRLLLWDDTETSIKQVNNRQIAKNSTKIGHLPKRNPESLYFTDSKTITIPKDAFSIYIDPLQKILKTRKQMKY